MALDEDLDDETAAELIEGVIDSAEAGLTDDELHDLGAAADHLRSDCPTPATDGGQTATAPDGGDLTRFQQDIIRILAAERELIGLEIKDELQQERGEEVNHGRLYPNIDDLVGAGYVDKFEIDKRTNGHKLTDEGKQLARRLAEQWLHATERLNGGEN
jgi:Transcriptional regulator PadR-like family.